jgi:hypothetical protein
MTMPATQSPCRVDLARAKSVLIRLEIDSIWNVALTAVKVWGCTSVKNDARQSGNSRNA